MSQDWSAFFDPSKAKGPRTGPDVGEEPAPSNAAPAQAGEGVAASPPPGRQRGPLTVSALIAQIKGALAEAFPQRLSVVGELSNVKLHGSGHLYFRLKDAASAIDAVMWRSSASRLKFRAEDGLEVVAEGKVDVYDVRGQLQFYVERMTPKGQGALELAFRQLREKLEREGLFAAAAKKAIPRFPRAIGVVTSPTGAAIRDIRRTLRRRWPGAAVYLMPALVQGDRAAATIAEALHLLDANAPRLGIETILLARGGGSLEDLWAFNEEVVARAVFAARTPIIAGVGHEADVTIADLVADVRAATPTAAAELAVPDADQVRRGLDRLTGRLGRGIREAIKAGRTALEAIGRSVVFRDPTSRLRTQAQRLDELTHRVRSSLRQALASRRRQLEPRASRLAALHPARLAEGAAARVSRAAHRLAWALGARSKRAGDRLAALRGRLRAGDPAHRMKLARQSVRAAARQLEAMSYRQVVRRGFSVTRGPGGAILRSAGEVRRGDRIETELLDGRIDSTVEGKPASAGAKAAPRTSRPKKRPPREPKLFD